MSQRLWSFSASSSEFELLVTFAHQIVTIFALTVPTCIQFVALQLIVVTLKTLIFFLLFYLFKLTIYVFPSILKFNIHIVAHGMAIFDKATPKNNASNKATHYGKNEGTHKK